MRNTTGRPSLAVIGLGEYYSKLRPGLFEHFNPTLLLDVNDSIVGKLSSPEAAIFKQLLPSDDVRSLLKGADLIVILTPNDTHAHYASLVADLGKPMVIEKPIGITPQDLKILGSIVVSGTPVYFSDFYVDIRAIPLRFAAGQIDEGDWRGRVLSGTLTGPRSLETIGQLRKIVGQIHETHFFRWDSWLSRAEAGGVVLDMMTHLFALLRVLFPAQELLINRCSHLYAHPEAAYKYVKTPSNPSIAEAFAEVEGTLSPLGVPVLFQVSKGSPVSNRHFTIYGTKGTFSQRFELGNLLTVSTEETSGQLRLPKNQYDLTCRAIKEWARIPSTHGWEWSSWATQKAIESRRARTEPSPIGGNKDSSLQILSPNDTKKVDRREFAITSGLSLAHMLLVIALIRSDNRLEARLDKLEKLEAQRLQFERGSIATLDLERAAGAAERYIDIEQVGLIRRLIGANERVLLCPGTEHSYGSPTEEMSAKGYPHDLKALAPFWYLAKEDIEIREARGIPTFLEAGDVILGTGSLSSSALARLLMSKSQVEITNLPYRIDEIPGEKFVKVYSEMEQGKKKDKRGKKLVDGVSGQVLRSDWDHVDNEGFLKKDLLVVSRLPGIEVGSDVILFSGFHGAGTQAAELLFRKSVFPIAEMTRLLELLGGERYWQFVLEVENVENIHNVPEPQRKTVAHTIRLSNDLPPKTFTPNKNRGEEWV